MNLRDQLQAIYDEHGKLTPALVVETAADPTHPSHSRIEWDDAIAGPQWRLYQGAQLIRAVKISYTDKKGEPQSLRAFTAVRETDSPQCNYTPTGEALEDEFTRQLILRDMDREWRMFQKRYGHMKEFAALIEASLQERSS